MTPLAELIPTSKLSLTLDHLQDAQKNLESFIDDQHKQQSITTAICSRIVEEIKSKREIIKTSIDKINAI